MKFFTASTALLIASLGLASATASAGDSSSSLLASASKTKRSDDVAVFAAGENVFPDAELINSGLDIDVDLSVGLISPRSCTAIGGSLLQVGVGLNIDIGPFVDIDVCVCLNVLLLPTQSSFQPCPDCGPRREPVCASGNCGCQCVQNAHPTGPNTCGCNAGFIESNGRCVLSGSGLRRRAAADKARRAAIARAGH